MAACKKLETQTGVRLLRQNIELRDVFVGFLIVAALAFTAASVVLFINHESDQAWLLHKISLVVFCSAFVGNTLPRHSLSQLRPTRQHLFAIAACVAVCGLAWWLRLHQLDRFPATVFFDEADNANAALRIVRNADYRPVYVAPTNLPAHFIYVIAWMFQHYGAEPLVLRYVAVLFGTASVALAFLLFRRWFGWPIALVGAFFLAVMREHLTFSRLAMHGISVPFFVLLGLYLLDRAWTKRRLFDWALLGLALGFGLCFYTPLRVFSPFVLAFLVAAGLWALIRRTIKLKDMLAPAAVLLIGCVIAVAPFGQFVVRNPDEVFARTDEVSLFNSNKRLEQDLPTALWNQTKQQLLMFTVRGDNNGRQNLPGAPLLDPILGVLFAAGLLMAMAQCYQRRNALMLLAFIAMLLPGILSLEIETPHALRSIGTLPIAVYFACLPLAWLMKRFSTSPWSHKTVALSALCLIVGVYNYNWFFNVQANDPRVWASYSPSETIVAREANQQMIDSDVILSDHFRYQPIAEYLIQDLSRVQSWNGQATLTLPTQRTRDLVVIVAPDQHERLLSLQSTCPAATLRPIASPIDQSPLALELRIPKQC